MFLQSMSGMFGRNFSPIGENMRGWGRPLLDMENHFFLIKKKVILQAKSAKNKVFLEIVRYLSRKRIFLFFSENFENFEKYRFTSEISYFMKF